MSKLVKISIDLMKIEKTHIIEGKNGGKYVNIDVWINDTYDDFKNNVGVKQSYKVGETFESHFIGNGRTGFGFSTPENSKPIEAKIIGGKPSNDLPFC